MKKFSKAALILWIVAALFFLTSFSFIPKGQIGEFFTAIAISVGLGFWGWRVKKKPHREAIKPAPFVYRQPLIPPTQKGTNAQSDDFYPCDNGDSEFASDTVTVTKQNLSTMKALKTFMNYVVIDFETTGFSAKSDKAIEVACLKIENGKSYEYQTLIDPQVHISSRITKINGLTDADVSGFPTIVPVAKQIYDFCGNLPFVAHNAPFDMGFLKQAYIEAGIKADLSYVDTLRLSRLAFPEYDNHKLSFLVQELSLAEKQIHRAMADVQCTKKLLDICISEIIGQKEIAKQSRKVAAAMSKQ